MFVGYMFLFLQSCMEMLASRSYIHAHVHKYRYTMQNRMQVLTGHNTDDLFFIFHTDVDVELCSAHDQLTALKEESAKLAEANLKRAGGMVEQTVGVGLQSLVHSRRAKRAQGDKMQQSVLYTARATRYALKSHPNVDISTVEQQLVKYSDLLRMSRTGKIRVSLADISGLMQRVAKAAVTEEHVHVWTKGSEDGAEWMILAYEGQYPWHQRMRGNYAYLDIATFQVEYLHRGMAEYVVRDEYSFAMFCRMLHYRKHMRYTAVIQVIPQHMMMLKDSESEILHRETYRTPFMEGIMWSEVPVESARKMAELGAYMSNLRERLSAFESRRNTSTGLLKRLTKETAAERIQHLYCSRLLRRKREQLSNLHFRHDSIAARLQV